MVEGEEVILPAYERVAERKPESGYQLVGFGGE
jgi:hypothetical protein